MTFKHWIINKRKRCLRWLLTKAGLAYGTLDTEQAIRDAYRHGVENTEQKYARQRTIYTLEPLTPASPIVHVDPVGQRQMYHSQVPDPLKAPEYIEQIRTKHEMPAIRPPWLQELVQQQEMCDTRPTAQADLFLLHDEVTGWSETVKRKAV